MALRICCSHLPHMQHLHGGLSSQARLRLQVPCHCWPRPFSTHSGFSKRMPALLERAAGLGAEAALRDEMAPAGHEDGDGNGLCQERGAQGARTGRFQQLPIVSPPDEHLNSAKKRTGTVNIDKGVKWRTPKLRDGSTKAKTLAAMRLDRMTKELASPMKSYVKGFPYPERLHPFERALMDLTVGADHYTKVLDRVDTTRKSILEVGKQLAARAAKAKNRKEAEAVEEEGLKSLEALYTKGSPSVDRLKQLAKELRRLPVVEMDTPTIALVGAPNVGKSSLVQTLSSGLPEICDYPFTTRTIKMGHFYVDGRRHQITDTPGLLARGDEERNAMEMLTLASLEHLPTLVIFVADLTEECGTSARNQWRIRCELKERFPSKPWVDVVSKEDLLQELLRQADASPLPTGGGSPSEEEDVQSPLDLARHLAQSGAIRVSSETGHGIDALQSSLLALVEEAYSIGMV
mmetsp:Transcript_12095/g.33988  ORF Transcript_12095/g.33988 Transcript_12095/m.33988 type:complete len:462 (-) Transcript_12095:356-1741(-)